MTVADTRREVSSEPAPGGRVCRPVRDTTGGPRTTGGRPRRLPPDLLRQASRRLEIMALVATGLWILAPLFGHLALHATDPADPAWAQFSPPDAFSLLGAVISLGLYLYLRSGERDPAFVMDLALVYMVATAFDLGVLMHWGRPAVAFLEVSPTITWVGPVILMFAAIVPVPPGKMLVAGLVAASMDGVGMVFWREMGRLEFGPLSNVLVMHYPNYLLLGVAVVISHVVTRLGQQVGREREMGSYRLDRLLGRGGMGEVHLATHRMLARPAAIKLMRPDVLAGADGTRAQVATVRFRREAEAAARLRSPHTVELYDFGVTEEGILYLVMELLEGITLDTLVREHGPQPAARVIHVLRQICDSLEEAHECGLVHRDIKPANIHIGRVGLQRDFVKVLDFGLVKAIPGAQTAAAAAAGNDTLATSAGLTPGTPAYMAPEMAQDAPVDGRADLYSLGCVAYFLLTGRQVFTGENGIQIILKHFQEPPTPPSLLTPNPIPPALEALVLACLAKRPEHRPASAAALARALGAIEVEPWSEEQAEEWWSGVPQHA